MKVALQAPILGQEPHRGLLGGVRIEYDGDQQGGRKEELQTTVGEGQSQPAMYVNYTKPIAGSPVVLEKCS